MQHKRHTRPLLVVALLVAIVAIAGVTLMAKDIPAPQKPVEIELDAKAFLEQKQ